MSQSLFRSVALRISVMILPLGLFCEPVAAQLSAAITVSPTQAAWGYPVSFDAYDSTLPDGVTLDELDIAWDFGDGSSGSGAQTTHVYTGKGKADYTVTLTLTETGGGAVSQDETVVTAKNQLSGKPLMTLLSPQKNATVTADDAVVIELAIDRATSGAEIDPATFQATLKKTDLTPYFAFTTDAADGGRIVGAVGTIPIDQFDLGSKRHLVKMSVESEPFLTTKGKQKVLKDRELARFSIEINERPTAEFSYTPDAPISGVPVDFDAGASNDPEGAALSYAWDFGDGNSSPAGSSATASHTYADPGDYSVKLTVSDGVWQESSEQQVTVAAPNEPPEACFTFDPSPAVTGATVTFDAACSDDPETQPLTYNWDFGDGSTGEQTTESTITHSFSAPDSYTVELVVSDGELDSEPSSQQVVVEGVTTGPVLGVSPETVAFGDLDYDLNIRRAPMRIDLLLEIRNDGDGPLELTEISSSDPAVFPVVAGADPLPTLAPGEVHFVNVQFRPREADDDPTPPLQDWTATLTITSNAGAPVQVPLTGRTVAAVIGGSARLMRFNFTSGRTPLPGAALAYGDVDLEGIIDEDGISNQGNADVQVTGVSIADDASGSFSVTMDPPEGFVVLAGGNGRSGNFDPRDARIDVAFRPTSTTDLVRETAKLIIQTGSGDLEVGLVGVGRYRCDVAFGGVDLEFERVSVGQSTDNVGNDVGADDFFLYPAVVRVLNQGRIAAEVGAAIEDLSPAGATQFAVDPAIVTVGGVANPAQENLQLSFAPTSENHKSALLRLTPTCLEGPPDAATEAVRLLHGYPKGSSEPMLGTTETWYGIEDFVFYDDDFDYVKMLRLKEQGQNGQASVFGDLAEIKDPFLKSDPEFNRVSVDQWEFEPSDLVIADDTAYTIDSDVFGPYFASDPENKPATETRLLAGERIGSGGILEDDVFIADDDGNDDVFADGFEDLELDVTADGTQVLYGDLRRCRGRRPHRAQTAQRLRRRCKRCVDHRRPIPVTGRGRGRTAGPAGDRAARRRLSGLRAAGQ